MAYHEAFSTEIVIPAARNDHQRIGNQLNQAERG